jgi:hypothetical protein
MGTLADREWEFSAHGRVAFSGGIKIAESLSAFATSGILGAKR